MRVLVTGSNGWIGKPTMQAARTAGHDPVGYDLVEGHDIFDSDQLAASLSGVDAVIHLAAIPHPISRVPIDDYWHVNVEGTRQVAAAASNANLKRLVYASSTAFYGAHGGFPWSADDLTVGSKNMVDRYYGHGLPSHTDPNKRPDVYYAMSKVAGETLLAGYAYAGLLHVSVCRFRPSPYARRPYEGLYVSPETAGRATVDALDDTDWYTIRDVEEPSVSD